MLKLLNIFLLITIIPYQVKAQVLFAGSGSAIGVSYQLQIHAPWAKLINQREKGLEFDGILDIRKQGEEEPWQTVPIKLAVRGTTSFALEECSFPKLKIKLKNTQNSKLLNGISSFKIATHCGDEVSQSPAGRVRNLGEGVGAEYLIYKLINVFKIPSQNVELAQITYIDSENKTSPITRPAFLLESEKMTSIRLAAKIIKYKEHEENEGPEFSNVFDEKINFVSGAMIYLLEAFIGNNDFSFPLTNIVEDPDSMQVGIKNILVLENNNKERFAMPQDFDLSAVVTGEFPPLSRNNFGIEPTAEADKIRIFVNSRVRDLSHQMLETTPSLSGHFKQAVADMYSQLSAVEAAISEATSLQLINEAQSIRFKTFFKEFQRSLKHENHAGTRL